MRSHPPMQTTRDVLAQRVEAPVATPRWQPDDSSMVCTGCAAHFTILNRRHHCRNCGGLFCGACARAFVHAGLLAPIQRRRCFDASPASPEEWRLRLCTACAGGLFELWSTVRDGEVDRAKGARRAHDHLIRHASACSASHAARDHILHQRRAPEARLPRPRNAPCRAAPDTACHAGLRAAVYAAGADADGSTLVHVAAASGSVPMLEWARRDHDHAIWAQGIRPIRSRAG